MFDRSLVRGVTGVYGIIRRETAELYVGSAADVGRRLGHHLGRLRRGVHYNHLLQSAWTEHGWAAFDFVLIEVVTIPTELRVREQWWMDNLLSYREGRGYNRATDTSSAGYRFTPEQRARVSIALKGKPKSAQHRARLAALIKSDAQRAWSVQLGKSGAGVPKSAEHRRKIGAAQRGAHNHGAKLTDKKVIAIRRRLAAGERGRDLARQYGVHESSIISQIKHGKLWKHVID